MNWNLLAAFSFTKLVVDDLDRMARFYGTVFGLKALQRLRDEARADPMEEIIMSSGDDYGAGPTLVLLKYIEKPKPQPGAVILGFITPDLDALIDRACNAGGDLSGEIEEHQIANVRVGMVVDPEGHVIEAVQNLAS